MCGVNLALTRKAYFVWYSLSLKGTRRERRRIMQRRILTGAGVPYPTRSHCTMQREAYLQISARFPPTTPSHTPTQSGCMHRRIPVASQFIIEPQQGNRASGHLKRSNVIANQRASNRDIPALEDFSKFAGYHVQLDQRRTAHAIDKSQHALARFQTQVFNDRGGEHFGHFRGRGELDTATTRLT